MIRQVAGCLSDAGYEVNVAYYLPLSVDPSLSVPATAIGKRSPSLRRRPWVGDEGVNAFEIGVLLPELEPMRYRPSGPWRRVVEAHDIHITVSGSVLPALPAVAQGKPTLSWIATAYWPDKRDRTASMGWARRMFDLLINTPLCLAIERYVAKRTRLLTLSSYTADSLDPAAGGEVDVLPIGIDTDVFTPSSKSDTREVGRIGYVGRLSDERKNAPLLLELLASLAEAGTEAELHLAGEEPPDRFREYSRDVGVQEKVDHHGYLDRRDLSDFYRMLDVFVIPSHQEGLAIVGLEAMACGCPVVSTECGGPEEYVRDGYNGYLVNASVSEMTDAVGELLNDHDVRYKMSEAAVDTVRKSFSRKQVEKEFWRHFTDVFAGPINQTGESCEQ